MLDRIQVHLRRCDTYARKLNSGANLRHALVDMFEALIEFWVEAIKVLRKHPVGMWESHFLLPHSHTVILIAANPREFLGTRCSLAEPEQNFRQGLAKVG